MWKHSHQIIYGYLYLAGRETGYLYFDHFYFYFCEQLNAQGKENHLLSVRTNVSLESNIFFTTPGFTDWYLTLITKLDSEGEERERRRTLILTAMCCPVGLFLLSYLQIPQILKTIQRLACFTC